jgi:transcriptional regulator with XRE-family HTH domain
MSLREHRQQRLMTVRELAAAASITPKTLVDIEHGRRLPHFGTIKSLAAALGVEWREVAEFVEAANKPQRTSKSPGSPPAGT